MEQAGSFDGQVRCQAYKLWELEGGPDGRTDEFWLEAKAIVSDRERARGVRAYERWMNAGRPLWQSDRFWFEPAEASQSPPAHGVIPAEADAAIVFKGPENASCTGCFPAFIWGEVWATSMVSFAKLLFDASLGLSCDRAGRPHWFYSAGNA